MKNHIKSRIEPVKPESFYTNILDCKIQSYCAFGLFTRPDDPIYTSPKLLVWCKYCDELLCSLSTMKLSNLIKGLDHNCPIVGYQTHELEWE
jgi:hypothetical protein